MASGLDELLGLGEHVIRRAAREGRPRADVLAAGPMRIRREDALDWMTRQE